MRTAPMCFSILRVPRCRVHSLVNTWWEGFDALNPTCKKGHNFRLLSSSVGGNESKNSGSWSRKPLITAGEGRSKNPLSSAANVKQELLDKVIATTSADSTINRTDGSSSQQIQYPDVRQLIGENKDLASLATIIVFDLETTGLKRDGDRIIEIALQDLHGGENSTFHTLVNPGRAVPNTIYHNISTNMVTRRGVPRMEELIPILLQFVRIRQKPGGYVVLVAHNARCFDVPFLKNEFRRCAFEIPSNWFFVDTLPLAREALKLEGVTSKGSLQALREHFEIPLEGSAHRAMADVRCLSFVLQKLTYVLKLAVPGLVQRAFTVSELKSNSSKVKSSSSKKKKDSS